MSTQGKEYKLAIRIAGIIDKSFTSSLAAANTASKRIASDLDKNFTTLDKGFDKIMGAGQKCFDAIASAAGVAALAIGAATAASVSVGIEFESAFTGVKKTVDATAEEYEALRQDILEMTRTIPSSAAGIAAVMEIAGQLGIAKESLTDFTETMINLGVSTTVSAEEASEFLAKFANIMTMESYENGISNFQRLGSAIVDLGNNFATNEGDIINIGTALAAAGKLAGMSEADIMGISAAMSSVGLTAEAGASSMSRLIMQMQQAVAAGGDELAQYGETAGMTGEQFAALFRDDAAGAVIEFISGLNKAGEGSYGILEDLELNTIRTRKAFLSLAGADGLMLDAVTLANEAWDENTALAIEAGKRYETTESQVQLMGNAFKELGIVAYDDLQDPLLGVIRTIKGSVNDLADDLEASGAVGDWIQNIETKLPTLQRKFKKFGEPVFNGITAAGKWIIKNGKGIVSVIAGIGAALAAYKIASTVTHIVSALMAISPASWIVIGATMALAELVSAVTAYKLHEQELINNDLAEHFGDIALSMKDIQDIAEYIVGSDSLGGVKKALEAFEDLDAISSNIERSVAEIDKMNWKVTIGMELTPEEQEQYKTTMDEYITSVQEYALQSQYAVSLNLSVAFDDDDLETTNIVTKVNQFYQDKYDELAVLGKELSDAVSDAFKDNFLEDFEIEAIMKIQSQMAAVQRSLATSEFDGKLALLGTKYGNGADINAESFQNLQAEIAEQIKLATEAYQEAYIKERASVQAAYDAGYLNDSELETAFSTLEKNYMQSVGDLQIKGIQFQIDTIMTAYGDEFDGMESALKAAMGELGDKEDYEMEWIINPVGIFDSVIMEAFRDNGIKKSTKGAVEALFEGMEPSVKALEMLKQQYEDMGIELSDDMLQVFADIDLIGAMTARSGFWGLGFKGDRESASRVLGSYIVDNEEYQWIEDILKGYGWELPDEVAANIEESAATNIGPAIDGMYAYTNGYLREVFAQGFDVNTNIRLNPGLLYPWQKSNMLQGLDGINNRADGGLATQPELTWFAEKGPEMAIPIDGSRNAISLWEQAGRLLGMDSVLDGLDLGSGGSAPSIEYKPTLQFYGAAPDQSDLESALKLSQDEFEVMMRRWLKDNARVAF